MDVPPAVDPDPKMAGFDSCLLLLLLLSFFFFPPMLPPSSRIKRALVCLFFPPSPDPFSALASLFCSVLCPYYQCRLLGTICRPEFIRVC